MSETGPARTLSAEEVRDVETSWPVVSSRVIHQDAWVVSLREDLVHRPGHEGEGEPFRRLVMEHPGAAIVLAVDDRERVCCLRQYRHAARATLIELPAGILDAPGEDPAEAAKRELREEVELEAGSWRLLASMLPSAGITTERHWIYLARDLTGVSRGDFALEHEEAEMETVWVAVDDLVEAVLDGRVGESPVAVAVLAYDAVRRRDR